MSGLRMIPLGVGEAFTAEHYTCCVAVGTGDEWMLVDCPHPIRKMMREASLASGVELDIDKVVAIAITHLHADHCCGLEDFAYYSYYALHRRARVVIHPEIATRLWDGLLAAGMEQVRSQPGAEPLHKTLDDYFELLPVREAEAVSVGPFTVECRPTRHSVPATAFRIRAGGRSIGVSGDTEYDPGLIDWLGAADLVVHEVALVKHAGVHTPYKKLATLPADVRAKMRLIHYPDGFDPALNAIERLEQGRLYVV